jgi:NAD(P)-dependent dehydrogenase (short-subunit alcohol dehydrogenase family)
MGIRRQLARRRRANGREKSITARADQQASGRIIEIAAMVGVLVDPEGRYTTSQTIHVNGGMFLAK